MTRPVFLDERGHPAGLRVVTWGLMTDTSPEPAGRGRKRLSPVLAGAVFILGCVEAFLRWPTMYQMVSPAVAASSWITNPMGTPLQDLPYVLGLCLLLAGLTAAVGIVRRSPGWALIALWAMVAAHVLLAANVLIVEFAVAYVTFCIARSAPRAVSRVTGVSVLLAAAVMTTLVHPNIWLAVLPIEAERAVWNIAGLVIILPALAVMAVAGIPWVVALSLRSNAEQSATAEELQETRTELAQIAENARLRVEQARLARDVHDVVGHSLTVILSQAQAGHFIENLPDAAAETFARISETARISLQDVRAVLASTTDPDDPVVGPIGELDDLIDGVKAAGYQLDADTIGIVRSLPDDVGAVAYRTLQEMLTNALRHGRPDRPLSVHQEWGQSLLLSVRNTRASSTNDESGRGTGIAAMEHRLTSVGGALHAGPEAEDFIAIAQIPLPAETPAT